MAVSNQIKNQHLLWRAGFGPWNNTQAELSSIQTKNLYAVLEKKSEPKPEYIDVADDVIKGIVGGVKDIVMMNEELKPQLSDKNKKEIRRRSIEDLRNLNINWLNEMIHSEAQLREKMSLFWHGHFACRIINIYYQQLMLHEIRKNALGNFGDLLRAVSKSAAMLQFLNNQQNRAQHPNENFAREVMELFTMGRGNYTEQDVKEAARAFTGWGFRLDGSFAFRYFFHDNGKKTILGKTGNFNGDDVLKILLEQKATANFIAKKIYKYFVNENADEEKVQWLAGRFYQNNYDIKALMNDIFTGSWFYDEKNISAKIKSPVELLVGIRRTLPMEMENQRIQILLQRAMGQVLFYPPNVAGWPGGRSWIDSSSLMIRLRIPQLIKDNDNFSIQTKDDDDQQMGMQENQQMNPAAQNNSGFRIMANVDWEKYISGFKDVLNEKLFDTIHSLLLQTQNKSVNEKVVNEMINTKTREDYIKTATVALMSTPEYQLC